jgi:hypothetical protein
MNLNPQRLDTISALMDSIERVEWRGYKVPGVRLLPGQEFLDRGNPQSAAGTASRGARDRHSLPPPSGWTTTPGWKFYPREELANRWKTKDGTMNETLRD